MKAVLRAAAGLRTMRFLTVGIGVALLFFALTYAFVSLGMPPFAGTVLAYAVAFVIGYSVQRNWTFGGGHDHGHALPRYFVLQLGCALGSGLIAHVAVDSFQMPPLAMSVLTTVAAGAVSYVASSLWVFGDHSRTGQ
jgi:putative flippase GtrA